jgi:D-3-phosphoglycerate dehydrogenase
MLVLAPEFDAFLCGDDEITAAVLEAGRAGKLRVISKYGVGLDKIDLVAAKTLGIPVTNCPGVNQNAVAEHVIALLLSYYRQIPQQHEITRAGGWKRMTGREIFGKRLGIAGLGAIGKELARKANALGMTVVAYDLKYDQAFLAEVPLKKAASLTELFATCDVVSLHMPHTTQTESIVNKDLLSKAKPGLVLINTARGKLVVEQDIVDALDANVLDGYLADVLIEEPIAPTTPLRNHPKIIITPHIGSRTYESVVKQGLMAVDNLRCEIFTI